MGNLQKVLNLIASKKHKADDIVLILEDDYLFISGGLKIWIEACSEIDAFVSPFDHPNRYIVNDDLFAKKPEIIIKANRHFRTAESTTSVIGGKFRLFKKTEILRKIPRFHFWFFWPGRIFGRELPSIDRVFYRRAFLFMRIKLFTPIPGLATHLSKFIQPENKRVIKKRVILPSTQLSPGVDWTKRYHELTKQE